MAWTAPMIHALLLRTPAPRAAAPMRVTLTARPEHVSPSAARHETTSGYGPPRG